MLAYRRTHANPTARLAGVKGPAYQTTNYPQLTFIMKHILLLLCVKVVTISMLQAQKESVNGWRIQGTVRDSATGNPLVRAAVIIDYEKIGRGTYTNAAGQFSLLVPAGKRTVVVRYVGYVSFRKSFYVSQNESLDIRLPSVASQLEEVIISSTGYDRNTRQPLLGVAKINIATLKRMPAALGEVDILRSLQLLPGVTSVGEAANGVNIRGGTTDQNLILLDDTPIFNPTHMFGLFSVFPADAVSSLELYKGSIPARYGGGQPRCWMCR